MMNKRIDAYLLILFLGTLPVSALPLPDSWSAAISQNASLADGDVTLGLSASGSVTDYPLGSFVVDASLSTGWTRPLTDDGESAFTFSIPALTFRRGNWRIGRQIVSDGGGIVISHPLDGLSYRAPGERISWWAGIYTSMLLNASNSAILVSDLDLQRSTADSYTFAAPRVVVATGAIRPGHLTVLAELWGQYDMRHIISFSGEETIAPGDESPPEEAGGTVDTLYPVLSLRIPIGNRIRLSVAGAGLVGTGIQAPTSAEEVYEPVTILSGAGRTSVQITGRRWICDVNGDISGGDLDALTFSEGNTDGESTIYHPISVLSRGSILGLEWGNSASSAVTLSTAPFSGARRYPLRFIQLVGEVRSFFRTTTGPLSAGDIDAESLSPYLGTEIFTTGRWNVNPDLTLSWNAALFFPGYAPEGAIDPEAFDGETAVFTGGVTLDVNL